MKDNVRQAIAFVVSRLSSGRDLTAVYDYSTNQYVNFSGTVTPANVSIFDHQGGSHISGTLPLLYHYGENSQISLEINGTHFQGFDYGSSSHFSGDVNTGSISLFDYGQGKYFQYSL